MSIQSSIKALINLLKTKDLNEIQADDLSSVVASAMTNDPAAKAELIKKTITDVVNLPTYIFWSKMEMFLRGTFHDFGDQIKMANRFEPETDDYERFTGKLITMLDQIEDTEKIPYYANLARAFLLECISKEVFFKLSKYLLQCTYDELKYLQDCLYEFSEPNSVMISALYQYGLFEQGDSVGGSTRYRLSGFAVALKQNSLNFNSDLREKKRVEKYEDMQPLNLPVRIESLTWGELKGITDGE